MSETDLLMPAIEGRSGPYEVEQSALASIKVLEAELAAATTKAERKLIRGRLRTVRSIASWCRSRAGYRVPE